MRSHSTQLHKRILPQLVVNIHLNSKNAQHFADAITFALKWIVDHHDIDRHSPGGFFIFMSLKRFLDTQHKRRRSPTINTICERQLVFSRTNQPLAIAIETRNSDWFKYIWYLDTFDEFWEKEIETRASSVLLQKRLKNWTIFS